MLAGFKTKATVSKQYGTDIKMDTQANGKE